MALDLTSGILTAIMGLIGVLLGALIGPFTNHQLGIRYNKRDLLFKRKLEYFEKVVETMEKNKRMYQNVILRLEDSDIKQKKQILEELKQNRINFFIMASPLYFNTQKFSDKIIDFVDIEKDIFESISNIKKAEEINNLKRKLEDLNRKTYEIILEMKKELARK